VKVPTGGRKKKLNRSVAKIEDRAASTNPHMLARTRTTSKYANPMVVAFSGISRCPTNVTTATALSEATIRKERCHTL